MEGHKTTYECTLSLLVTFLFVCVLQGNVGNRQWEQWVNCCLVLGWLTILGASLRPLLAYGV